MLFPLKDINPTSRTPYVTWGLVLANSLVFIYQFFFAGFENSIAQWGLIPQRLFDSTMYVSPGGPGGTIRLDHNPLLTLFTSMFLHGGFLHLVGNMLYLWIFGNNVEDRLGPAKFLAFYLLGGVLASLTHVVVSTISVSGGYMDSFRVPMVGASGAVAAVLGAYFRLYPRTRVRCLLFLLVFVTFIELPAALVLGWWIIIQFLNLLAPGRLGASNVAWSAHIGGFFAGMILLSFFGFRRKRSIIYVD